MSYYPAILIVGALVISFTFFSFTMFGWCTRSNDTSFLPTTGLNFDDKFSVCTTLESHSITYHYKAAEEAAKATNMSECVICLTAFEEEESVRKLHNCKHVFHTSCIDQWLSSHSGCPLCRTQIDKVNSTKNGILVASEENDHMIMVIVNS
ncbi:hypothetical protein RIF29_29103 [Crotalaria pallida]|uniref:RING-type domain-containing protein n=1 Tax=Crotalaria pallida TaxID=3830 RepID=A0AAN9I020_CROPI